jgi:2-polyprenyl-3-methyl-5-hydroxy-6-metoxy-1,4-benzoquinol methylase
MFKIRSTEKELLDRDDIPEQALRRNLMELDVINRYLGGYSISKSALKKVLKPKQNMVLVDIGCGGGHTLKNIHEWSLRKRYSLQLAGIDKKETCIRHSIETNAGKAGLRFICDDYRNADAHLSRIDVIHASLFCHHLSEDEIKELITYAREKNIILVINDLQRNALSYFAIKALTALFSRSYLVKNDAPLSVLRGFKKSEWERILKSCGTESYSIENKWAFRHQVIVHP